MAKAQLPILLGRDSAEFVTSVFTERYARQFTTCTLQPQQEKLARFTREEGISSNLK